LVYIYVIVERQVRALTSLNHFCLLLKKQQLKLQTACIYLALDTLGIRTRQVLGFSQQPLNMTGINRSFRGSCWFHLHGRIMFGALTMEEVVLWYMKLNFYDVYGVRFRKTVMLNSAPSHMNYCITLRLLFSQFMPLSSIYMYIYIFFYIYFFLTLSY
jgi:hypothetical protein